MAFGILSCHIEVRKWAKPNQHVYNRLVSLLGNEYDQLTNEYAAMWVRNMCGDYTIKTAIANNQEAMSNLIGMLSFNDPDAVFNALGAIDSICADFDARNIVRELKGIEPILNLIKSEFPQIQELVFSSLIKLTHNGSI
jgi:hypothetical protein